MNELLSGIGVVVSDKDLEEILKAGEDALRDLFESGLFEAATTVDVNELGVKPQVARLIKTIYVNYLKKTVTVKFMDGEVRTSHCHEHDEFDVAVGVSLCISYYLFGSRTAYNKYLAVNAYNHVIDGELNDCASCSVPVVEKETTPAKQIKKEVKKTKSRVKHL